MHVFYKILLNKKVLSHCLIEVVLYTVSELAYATGKKDKRR